MIKMVMELTMSLVMIVIIKMMIVTRMVMVIKSESSSKYTFRLSSPPRVARQFVNWGRCTRLTTSQMQKDQQHEITLDDHDDDNFSNASNTTTNINDVDNFLNENEITRELDAHSTLVFTHHSFDKGHRDGVKRRHPSHSFKITHLIVFELHFYIPTRLQGPRTKPTRSTPTATQTEPSKARGNSCGRFPGPACCGNFPREFHHRILEGPARGGAAVSLETFANYRVSQKNSDFWTFRYTIIHIWQLWTNNVPRDICQLRGVPEKFWFLKFQVHKSI